MGSVSMGRGRRIRAWSGRRLAETVADHRGGKLMAQLTAAVAVRQKIDIEPLRRSTRSWISTRWACGVETRCISPSAPATALCCSRWTSA